jgi:hypothetical protein
MLVLTEITLQVTATFITGHNESGRMSTTKIRWLWNRMHQRGAIGTVNWLRVEYGINAEQRNFLAVHPGVCKGS